MKQTIFHITSLFLLTGFFGCAGKIERAPILILATENGFGTYTQEILKTEGFRGFEVDSLNSGKITSSYLSMFDLVILTESVIDQETKEMFQRYVENGGNLIAFRPDQVLAELFGVEPKRGSFSEGYIKIDPNTEQSSGMISEALQYHGAADLYALTEGRAIATLVSEKLSDEEFPAVVSNNYLKGHAIAFLYNLPKSIVYTRQGNPEFAGIEKDGIPGLRSLDLFTDGWVDTSKNTINQADQHMALLSNCIQYMNSFTKPLPRFWYFPDTLKCLATLTNDGEFRSEYDFEPQFQDADSMGAKMSLYILEADKVSKNWVSKWTSKGFEIAGHPDYTKEAGNPTWNGMDSALNARIHQIKSLYDLEVRTNVNHWFVWCGRDSAGAQDFGAQAILEERNGIELDINYAHYDINSSQGNYYLGSPGINQGNFTGSGLVMRFASASGRTINVYQQFNSVYDQQYMESHDPEGFFNCFKGLVDRSLNDEIFSFVSIKAHNDEYFFSKGPILKMLAYAKSKGIPVWTAANLLDFIKMRDDATFSSVIWLKNRLSFTINSRLTHKSGLTFMVPASYGGENVKTITKDGKEVPVSIKHVRGMDYAFVTVESGKNHEISVDYTY
ncbi:MAG: hypothetical protein U5K79_03520 [Cyclobacteriaceae bacterium]|nr:hypothetical protein [Cyclobacteriaceae bacterium]